MKCDRCGKPSVYHSTLIINGVSETKNLCRECAIKEGVFTEDSLFDDIFNTFASISPLELKNDIVCPVCKTSLREFNSTRKLGCPNCYEVFRDSLNKLLARIAPNTSHKQVVTKTSSKADKISALKADLAKAVKEERYEDASKIKKQIQALEAENE